MGPHLLTFPRGTRRACPSARPPAHTHLCLSLCPAPRAQGLHSFVKHLPLRGREGEPGWQQPSLWDLMGTLSELSAVAL